MGEKGKSIFWKCAELCVVLGIGVLLIGGILYKSGALKSGYHFVDDHEIVRLEMSIDNGAKLGETIGAWIRNDIHWRFRPFYWVERVTGGYLFGTDMFLWNLYTALKGVLAFLFLYYVARKLRHNPIVSLLFPCIIIFGAQFTPWYRSANQENTGLLLMAVELWLIAQQYAKKKFKSRIYHILIVLFAILCGLTKESFAMCIPAFIALRYWLEYCAYSESSENVKFIEIMKNNVWLYIALLIVGVTDFLCIMFLSGVDNVSYAGFQQGVPLRDYVMGIVNSLTVFLKWYTLFGVMILFVLLMCYQMLERAYRRQYIGFALIGVYIMTVQLVGHAKSLLANRYIIPFIVGYAFVFVLLGYDLFRKRVFQRRVYVAMLLLLLGLELPVAYEKAKEWAWDGRMTALYFQCILDNTTAGDNILSCFTDNELNLSTDVWLSAHNGPNVEYHEGGAIDADKYVAITCYQSQVAEILDAFVPETELSYTVCEYTNYAVIVIE